ncbi:sulfide/dihydroorotate dehydrogenase-like FAD/NAD-binding protein [bacterium]|nr:MAG: sulfide/dihydroorotate dehydrogenase-like FAD/NAD-binding protein [bacterium]
MFRVIEKSKLTGDITRIVVAAPDIALKAGAGQFVMVVTGRDSERIPLTIADTDTSRGTLTLIFQEIGFSTKELGALSEGDTISHILGPLGNPTHIEKYGTVICVGGGVGIAEIFPVTKAMKRAENRVIGIIGARSKELVILEEKLKQTCDELFITTDDGSYGKKGYVTDVLSGLLKVSEQSTHTIYPNLVYAVGPVPMMRKIAQLTKEYNIKTIVSLNPIMVDATGMCGSCRVTVAGVTRFGCVDGPEFDAHLVDFDELQKRLASFKEKEECLNKKCPAK